jgi:hypothetical protein
MPAQPPHRDTGSITGQLRAAWRRKALVPVGLPVGVLALDGKVTALPCINGEFAQTQHPEQGLPYGLIRTVTCALVSAAGLPSWSSAATRTRCSRCSAR